MVEIEFFMDKSRYTKSHQQSTAANTAGDFVLLKGCKGRTKPLLSIWLLFYMALELGNFCDMASTASKMASKDAKTQFIGPKWPSL